MIGKLEISRLLGRLNDNPNISLYLFEEQGTQKNPCCLYKLSIEKGISDKLIEIVSGCIDGAIQLLKTEGLRDFPVYNPDANQKVFRISSEKVGVFEELFPKIVEQEDPKQFNMNKVKEEKLKGWVVRVELEIEGVTQQILFFQKFQRSKMLAKKEVFIFEADDGFKLVKNNLLAINEEFDSFYKDGTIIVFNMYSFEKMFGYEEFYKRKATVLVDKMSSEARKAKAPVAYKIADKSIVIEKIQKSNRIARNFYKAKKSEYYKCIRYSKLKSINEKYKIGLILDDNRKMWTIGKETNLYAAGKILNDDFQKSQLTKNEYLSMGKEKDIKSALNIKAKRGKERKVGDGASQRQNMKRGRGVKRTANTGYPRNLKRTKLLNPAIPCIRGFFPKKYWITSSTDRNGREATMRLMPV